MTSREKVCGRLTTPRHFLCASFAGGVQKLPTSNCFRPVVDSDLQKISCKMERHPVAWCLLEFAQIAMKPTEFNQNSDQNWAWPEKTWFRERLNTLRAREHEAQRRPTSNRRDPAAVEAKPNREPGSDEV